MFRFLVITAFVLACNQKKTEVNKKKLPESAEAIAAEPKESFTVLNNEKDLPSCDSASSGRAYFVKDSGLFYYCQGAQWQVMNIKNTDDKSDTNLLTKSDAISPGTECVAGGVRYQLGEDKNSNSLLDDSEVDPKLTKIMCNLNDKTDGNALFVYDKMNTKVGRLGFQSWINSITPILGVVIYDDKNGNEIGTAMFEPTYGATTNLKDFCNSKFEVNGQLWQNTVETSCRVYFSEPNCKGEAALGGFPSNLNVNLVEANGGLYRIRADQGTPSVFEAKSYAFPTRDSLCRNSPQIDDRIFKRFATYSDVLAHDVSIYPEPARNWSYWHCKKTGQAAAYIRSGLTGNLVGPLNVLPPNLARVCGPNDNDTFVGKVLVAENLTIPFDSYIPYANYLEKVPHTIPAYFGALSIRL